MIAGYVNVGQNDQALKLFEEMRNAGEHPDEVTMLSLLSACSQLGDLETGKSLHFSIFQAGLLTEAFQFIDKMNVEPNGIIWRTLLGACALHGNIEIGKRATERLMKLRRDESGDYVLLSNMYAAVGEWGGFEKVRQVMDDYGVWKEPGYSIVEPDNKAVIKLLSRSRSSHVPES
ncbi:unnamed protein product [Linum tenue]|uniref:Pentatricopeptide repeat-containing protein n=1 Tax=Linum tenue TaxID=586396 RepID=A0AAV0N666_9ROSI|nr:unnamed protein product [Linum tenue]